MVPGGLCRWCLGEGMWMRNAAIYEGTMGGEVDGAPRDKNPGRCSHG